MQRRAVPAPWLAAAAAAFALLAIGAAPWALDAPLLNFVFKPLATLTIIVPITRVNSARLKRNCSIAKA